MNKLFFKNSLAVLLFFISYKINAQPDLSIDLNYLQTTIKITTEHFSLGSCDVSEGCTIATQGLRKLLRFGLRQENVGDKKFNLGRVTGPNAEPYFHYDACHGHYHFDGFSKFELFGLDNCNKVNTIGTGKMGGCMYNYDPDNPCKHFLQFNNCNYKQGISAGCADVYHADLPCQYVDIKGIPDGRYILKVTINWDQALIAAHSNLQESSYTNNTAYVLINIQGNNVTVLSIANTIRNNISLANLDFLPPFIQNKIKNKRILLARSTIIAGPNTTFNDNKQRDLIAGSSITFFSGTTISSQPGGIFAATVDPCLSSANFKTINDGDFFSTIDSSLIITAEEYALLNNEEEEDDSEDYHTTSENNLTIQITPNPSFGKFTIELPEEISTTSYIVYTYDVLGKIVYQEKTTERIKNIDLSTQPKGIYFLKLQTKDNAFTQKIIIQ